MHRAATGDAGCTAVYAAPAKCVKCLAVTAMRKSNKAHDLGCPGGQCPPGTTHGAHHEKVRVAREARLTKMAAKGAGATKKMTSPSTSATPHMHMVPSQKVLDAFVTGAAGSAAAVDTSALEATTARKWTWRRTA